MIVAPLTPAEKATARRWLPVCRAALRRPSPLPSVDQHQRQMAGLGQAVTGR